MYRMMLLPVFCLGAAACSPEGTEQDPSTTNKVSIAAPAALLNPLDRPVPNLADTAALTEVLNSLSTEGGTQSDRSIFNRWVIGKVLVIELIRKENNGRTDVAKLGASFSSNQTTVGDVIRMQGAKEAEENERVEKNRVRHAQGICEKMRAAPEHSSFWVGFGSGYTIGGKNYDDPCQALRENGHPELDDSEEAVRSRANEARVKDQTRNEDEELERRWREEFGNR